MSKWVYAFGGEHSEGNFENNDGEKRTDHSDAAAIFFVAAQEIINGVSHHAGEEDDKSVQNALQKAHGDHVAVGNVRDFVSQNRFNLVP